MLKNQEINNVQINIGEKLDSLQLSENTGNIIQLTEFSSSLNGEDLHNFCSLLNGKLNKLLGSHNIDFKKIFSSKVKDPVGVGEYKA